MASDGLIEAYWKTERAKYHIQELKLAIEAFRKDSNAYVITREDDIERGLHLIHVKFNQPHVWINMIAGDALHCLRASLDYAIYRLAQDSIPSPEKTQFPIVEKDNSEGRKRFRQQTKGVSPEAIKAIEALQPYSRPDGMPLSHCALWLLNEMCVIDKHMRIPMHSSAITVVFPNIPRASGSLTRHDDGSVISIPLAYKPEEALDPIVSFQIVFGDLAKGVVMTVEQIEEIHKIISESILPGLARFCK